MLHSFSRHGAICHWHIGPPPTIIFSPCRLHSASLPHPSFGQFSSDCISLKEQSSAIMDQLAGEECGICLDALKNPVALPCSHRFCSECLNGWRPKYGAKSGDKETNTKCPLCREKIPPSREMVAQLKFYQTAKSCLVAKGDVSSEDYMMINSEIERLERKIGDWTETIDYSEDKICVVLPTDVCRSAAQSEIRKLLNWLGPPPVDKQRVNAKDPEAMDTTWCTVQQR